MVTKAKKKLISASIVSQKKWGNMPIAKKNNLRRMLPDFDKDGVPDGFDCRPRNKRKQEDCEPSDREYIKSLSKVKLDKKLGAGIHGEFYTIEDNDRFGIKTPLCPIDEFATTTCKGCTKKYEIIDEAVRCRRNNLNSTPMMSHTRITSVTMKNGHKCIGLVRPIVTPIDSKNIEKLTDSQLKQIHDKVQEVTNQGIMLGDGIQCGFTVSGRLLQFDLDDVSKSKKALSVNRKYWRDFLAHARGVDRRSLYIYDINPSELLHYLGEENEPVHVKEARLKWHAEVRRQFKPLLLKFGDITR
jgi:hypothetical protein